MKLYSHYLSSCSFRVRIALRLKGLDYEYKALDVLNGEHFSPEFLKLNPLGMVPVLVDGDIVIADSFAILMYLEEKYPQHPLLPSDLHKRALSYQAANIVSSSIQPFQNPRIQKYIGEKAGLDEMLPWVQHHINRGFTALEKLLNNYAGKYAVGDEVSLVLQDKPVKGHTIIYLGVWLSLVSRCTYMLKKVPHEADVFIAPQIDAASKRFKVDMTEYPLLSRLNKAYELLPAFQDAMPDKQPDSPSAGI